MDSYSLHSPTFVEIDMAAFRNNIEEIKKKLSGNAGFIAVVKADAYGHGAAVLAREAVRLGSPLLAVARFNEAMKLRQEGIDSPILIFGYCDETDIYEYAVHDIRPTVNTVEDAERISSKCSSLDKNVKVHVKVDTGMGRHGICCSAEESVKIMEEIAAFPNIEIEGIYSHFANSDTKDKRHALFQLDKFEKIRKILQDDLKYNYKFHIANSAAIMEIPQSHYDLVRPGIILYGLKPSDETENHKINLHPVMSLKTKITQLKRVPAGFSVSYGSTFITEKETVIATVPVGYADGYSRLLSSKGEMLVRGKRAPVIGRVCMDLCMIDVTGIPGVKPNDEVVVFGKQGEENLSVDELAEKIGTINYEVVSMISPRVPRIYINE